MNAPSQVPSDFKMMTLRPNPYIDPLGPLYGKREDGSIVLGFVVEPRHCNPGGSCHGGMLMTMADMLLILNANAQSGIEKYMVTVNLTCDFVGPAMQGDWIEGRASLLRASKNMVFIEGSFTNMGKPVARINAIFKPTGEPNSVFSQREILE